jgi:hypothetical protein
MRTLIFLAALVTGTTLLAASDDEVLAVLELAEARYSEALALEHGWSVTEPLMQEAREALAAGDSEAALELAERALLTAEQALRQADEEKRAWQQRALPN